jgi:glycosyltransferase involved in cell wall biosynthesis
MVRARLRLEIGLTNSRIPAVPHVVFVLPDKMGGMLNIVANLLAFRKPDGMQYDAVLVHNPLSVDTRFGGTLAADTQTTVEYQLPLENLHAVLRRLDKALPHGPGILVSNDWLELALVATRDTGLTVVQLLHGDHEYYYDLAEKHQTVIDVFVAYSLAMRDGLIRRLPHRRASIVHLPYGIPLPRRIRNATSGPLRLVFSGRLEDGQKGVFYLPLIDALLAETGTEVVWTIIGGGPDAAELKRRWTSTSRVRWLDTRPKDEVVDLLADQDVFVLPTRTEGFPVSLLEAMSAGLVSVVSDIPSGVPEVVRRGETGFLPAVGDVKAFAAAISLLANDRDLLERMSSAARAMVERDYDIRDRVADYQQLFARFAELRRPRPASAPLHYGSRLDRPWIPNPLVRAIRGPRRWLRQR